MDKQTAKDKKYTHGEAFNLMFYQCEDCKAIEILWNSRDGVTPFIIPCRYCKGPMQHAYWQLDRKMPENFTPHDGMRIFVDLTQKRHDHFTRKKIDLWWDHKEFPMSENYTSKANAFDLLSKEFDPERGEPDILIVGEEKILNG